MTGKKTDANQNDREFQELDELLKTWHQDVDERAAKARQRILAAAGADAEAISGAHSYTADDIEITGTITATGQTVTLASTTAGDAIDVGDPGGGGDNVADTLELAGAEIQNITAANLNIVGALASALALCSSPTAAQ